MVTSSRLASRGEPADTTDREHADLMDGTAQPPLPVGGGEDASAAKKVLRHRLLAARRARLVTASPAGDASEAAAALARRVVALPEVVAAERVAAYVGIGGEPDTSQLLTALLARDVRVLLPVVRPDLDLDFREFTGTLLPGALGTVEPPPAGRLFELGQADAVIVPAVAVDRAGRRLGRGGGSYDRALAGLGPHVPVIAVVDDSELLDHVPAEAHDRPVTVVVTPRRTWRCEPT